MLESEQQARVSWGRCPTRKQISPLRCAQCERYQEDFFFFNQTPKVIYFQCFCPTSWRISKISKWAPCCLWVSGICAVTFLGVIALALDLLLPQSRQAMLHESRHVVENPSKPSLVRTPCRAPGTQQYLVRGRVGTGFKGGCACVCTHAQGHVGPWSTAGQGWWGWARKPRLIGGAGEQRQRGAADGNQAGGDLDQLMNVEAGRRIQAEIMGRCLWGQSTEAWAFSLKLVLGVFPVFLTWLEIFCMIPVSHVRSVHIPRHS